MKPRFNSLEDVSKSVVSETALPPTQKSINEAMRVFREFVKDASTLLLHWCPKCFECGKPAMWRTTFSKMPYLREKLVCDIHKVDISIELSTSKLLRRVLPYARKIGV